MPLTAEQSYALGTRDGRDRINQQLRADPQYQRFLQSIGVNTGGPIHLSDQQRKQAADWVRARFGSIGGLEIDPSGNLNNPQGFGTQLEQWGPVAAGAGLVAAPFVLPALGVGGGGAAASGGVLPSASIPGMHAAVPASIASQGVSAGAGGAAAGGLGTAGTVGTAAAGSGVGSKLASGGMDALKGLASPEGAAGLAALIAGLMGQRDYQEQTDDVRRVNAINEARMRRVDPLHQVATNLAFGRLPVNYRQGVSLNNVPLPE